MKKFLVQFNHISSWKKCYIDKIQESTGEIDYVFRGKGLTQNSILHTAELKEGLMNLFKSLFDGNVESFDLTYGQPSFNMNKNFIVETIKKFIHQKQLIMKEIKMIIFMKIIFHHEWKIFLIH